MKNLATPLPEPLIDLHHPHQAGDNTYPHHRCQSRSPENNKSIRSFTTAFFTLCKLETNVTAKMSAKLRQSTK